jgi:hypothetical protein
MPKDFIHVAAGSMFSYLFGLDDGSAQPEARDQIRELVNATLDLRALPENPFTVRFQHALCETEMLSVKDRRAALVALRDQMDGKTPAGEAPAEKLTTLV